MEMPRESLELMKTLADADPAAPTACSQWTVHDLVAHLAAGAKENADLIEDALAGVRPVRHKVSPNVKPHSSRCPTKNSVSN